MAKNTTTKKTTAKKATTDAPKAVATKKVKKTVAATRSTKKNVAEKRVAEKKVAEKKVSPEVVEETVEMAPSATRSVKIHRSTVLIALGIIIVAFVLYYGRGLFVAAVVNGQPISRLSLVQEAEKQSGRQAMEMLVRNVMVEQEAKEKNVNVTDKDVAGQVKTIETNLSKQGQKLDDMLKLEGMTRDDLHEIVRLDLLVTKLVENEIKVTDKDVADYIEKNKDILPTDKKDDELKKLVRERIKQEQLPEKAQAWFAELEKKASVVKFVNY